ncbi:MAG TPA: DMT family transporter [Azospirillaceae bacterium]|nr:DMT family transporter [Azospirillaceae bacterium]
MTMTPVVPATQPLGRLRPLALLLATGSLLGALFPLGKLAAAAGVAPLAWSLSMLLSAGVLLTVLAAAQGQAPHLTAPHLRYYASAGLLSMAMPNLILFSVMPQLGAGLSAVVYTLPPILTLVLAALIGLERPGRQRLVGIGLGFAGAALIVGPRGSLPSSDQYGWMALALTIPVFLAMGNIYRTRCWPAGASPLQLSAGAMLAGAFWIALASAATGQLGDIATLAGAPALASVQGALNALQFLLFMRLQKSAGPVYVSQIGYVATAVGLASGAIVFGETYSPWVWAASGLIASGVILVNFARRP